MRKILEWLLLTSLRSVLWLRYRLKIEGEEFLKPDTLNRPGGVLFLPNHPAYFVDPILVAFAVWRHYPIRPMVIEYMYYLPLVNTILRFLKALPVPNFHSASNSIKRRRNDLVFDAVVNGLKSGDNFLIYPGGGVKYTAKEVLGGVSGIHRILQEIPDANVVLVRTKGLWGSSFSRAVLKEPPTLWGSVTMGIKIVFKNLFFFTPRRTVTICFQPAPEDFPRRSSRLDLNRYFEEWYNQPDGLIQAREPFPGDSLMLVSYSMWGENYMPLLNAKQPREEGDIDSNSIPKEVRKKVLLKLSQMLDERGGNKELSDASSLTTDLGFDSLDLAELSSFLQDEFDIAGVPMSELTTIRKLMALAAGQITCQQEIGSEVTQNLSRWEAKREHRRASIGATETVHETFLAICNRMGGAAACADDTSGVLTFDQMKMRVLLLAEYIRSLPGDYIGILLPASVAANILVLACQLVGKIPMMVNWTIGPRHLEAVVKLSNVQVVLTSWSFIDRLENVNFEGIEEKLIMLEEVRRAFSPFQKAKAWFRSKLSKEAILRTFNSPRSPDTKAVLLFTSGTESMPKGVPLTHGNVLSNQRASLESVEIYTTDVMYGILPPFHAFGFTISSLMALLGGVRVAYFPNPTDGKRLVKGFVKWGVTILCGAPTFLKSIARAAQPGQLDKLRLCVSGAEKAPPELFELFAQHGKREILIEGYGITECAPVLTLNRPGLPLSGVGAPISGVELCIVHPETHALLSAGEQGLVLATGPNIFHGYLNPDLSPPFLSLAEKKWYITGDLGVMTNDNHLHIVGRQKRFIKVGGEMVSLTAIEEALLHSILHTHASTEEEGPLLAVCASERPGEKPKVSLFCRFPISLDEANQYLRDAGFSNLVKLSQVFTLPQIPIMGSGKINYRLLELELPNTAQ